ncbi:50S ribosomal protein L16 [Candidatus Tremblaya princeps]|uniref:50S ribosomal protein L16 n=1 Tax=Tremblaya princeps TaxID=189385 RepID=A0A143WNW2_TREPR|nr:50S ribosomal protein L16 [Candidatus Tremblaya princeps]
MLQPCRRKYRKEHKGRNRGLARSGSTIVHGALALRALSRGRLSSSHLEAGRRAITHSMRRAGLVTIRVFPDKPISRKPAEVRMGNGKGSPDHYVFEVRPGKIIYEVGGVDDHIARSALRLAMPKLPVKTALACR